MINSLVGKALLIIQILKIQRKLDLISLSQKKQKDQIYTKNRNAHDGYLVSDMDGTILETPKKSTKGVTPSQYEAQIDHKKPKSKGGENKGDNAQVLSRKQNRDKWDTS